MRLLCLLLLFAAPAWGDDFYDAYMARRQAERDAAAAERRHDELMRELRAQRRTQEQAARPAAPAYVPTVDPTWEAYCQDERELEADMRARGLRWQRAIYCPP